ncbi:hypothetical protein CsSME_00001921 [Camellia sinensis var. sinensis]
MHFKRFSPRDGSLGLSYKEASILLVNTLHLLDGKKDFMKQKSRLLSKTEVLVYGQKRYHAIFQ